MLLDNDYAISYHNDYLYYTVVLLYLSANSLILQEAVTRL